MSLICFKGYFVDTFLLVQTNLFQLISRQKIIQHSIDCVMGVIFMQHFIALLLLGKNAIIISLVK